MASFRNVDLDRLASGFSSASRIFTFTNSEHYYLGSYPFILRHFATLRLDGSAADIDRFWQAVILVYSWMFRGKLTRFEDPAGRYRDICSLLRDAKHSGTITASDLDELSKTICQGSVIATSKLLHFLKPESFAIWDTRVARVSYSSSHYVTINRPAVYLDYMMWLKRLKIDRQTISTVRRRLGDTSASRLRVKEFILFMTPADAPSRKRS